MSTSAQSLQASNQQRIHMPDDQQAAVYMDWLVRKVLGAITAYEVSSRQHPHVESSPWRDELHRTLCGFLRDWCERGVDGGGIVQPLSAVRAYVDDVHDPKVLLATLDDRFGSYRCYSSRNCECLNTRMFLCTHTYAGTYTRSPLNRRAAATDKIKHLIHLHNCVYM